MHTCLTLLFQLLLLLFSPFLPNHLPNTIEKILPTAVFPQSADLIVLDFCSFCDKKIKNEKITFCLLCLCSLQSVSFSVLSFNFRFLLYLFMTVVLFYFAKQIIFERLSIEKNNRK